MRQSGFTFIEILIYSAILIMVLTSVLIFVSSIFGTSDNLRLRIELLENAKFLEQKIRWAVLGASQINLPSGGATGPELSLQKEGFSGSLVFDSADGRARLKIGTANAVPITNEFVEVKSLSFGNFVFPDSAGNFINVKAELQNIVIGATTSLDFWISTK